MKEKINKLSEKQIALITLSLTIIALIIGIALPEIRVALGLDSDRSDYRAERSQSRDERIDKPFVEAGNVNIPKPPKPPGTAEENLPKVEIKKDYENSSFQNGEFIIYSGITFKNTGMLTGKIIIQKGATFINSGAIEGDVLNKAGTFKNTGYLDGALTVE